MSEKDRVMELDKQFCLDCKQGKEEAWVSYFLDDGQMITQGHGKNLVGKDEIRNAMKRTFSLPDLVFDWEPDYCEISEDNTLAVTRGKSTLTYTKEDETVTIKGNYTTIWKKINDTWKIVWDIGN